MAAAAGFLDIYIQATTILRDSSSPLGGWLPQEYKVLDVLTGHRPMALAKSTLDAPDTL